MQADRRAPFALIVEDHPLVADSLVACVRECDAGLKVEMAESLVVALRILVKRPAPLLIVTDLTLTDAQGTQAVKSLRQAAPQSPILVFTALDDPTLRREAQALGAIAYLIKSTSSQTLRDEIRAVIGARPVSREAAPGRKDMASRLLTRKQVAVLEELVAGRSNKEIATRLSISDDTVGSHLKEIFNRLGARNRTEAVVRYLEMVSRAENRRRR
jgi:DNA-binding NarL/FixJ family response regulator